MRKGLVVSLGVALVLSVVPAFSEAPIISCIPDIIISDLDLAGQTADSNMFVFENALDLDEFVQDNDTAADTLRWSFIESGANTLELNGKTSVNPADVLNPPDDKNLRQTTSVLSLENVAMGATSPTQTTDILLIVSDGEKVSSQSVNVQTVNVDAGATSLSQGDALVMQVVKNYQFTTDAEGWIFSSFGNVPGIIVPPTNQYSNGALVQTAAGTQGTAIVYGSYETPKAPADAVRPKVGCILRARYNVKSTATTGAQTPGFRLHAVTKHVAFSGGQWVPDFGNLDFIDEAFVQYYTFDFVAVSNDIPGRIPGAGRDYYLLYYPQQIPETLLSTTTITYFTFELLDTEVGDALQDAGSLSLDSLVVDAVDRPELGAGSAVSEFSITDFTTAGWNAPAAATPLNLSGLTPNITGMTASVTGGNLVLTVAPGNQYFEAFIFSNVQANLIPGNYYRFAWELDATVSGTFVEPRVRTAVVSSYAGIYAAVKELQGGAAVAGLTSEAQTWEQWIVAPSSDPRVATSALTEPMVLRFGTWQLGAAEYPVTSQVGGSVRALSLRTESFEPIP